MDNEKEIIRQLRILRNAYEDYYNKTDDRQSEGIYIGLDEAIRIVKKHFTK